MPVVAALHPLSVHRFRGTRFLLPLAAAALLFLAVVLGAFHHHEDLTNHPDCAICAVAHHAPAATVAPSTLTIFLPELSILVAPPFLAVVITRPNAALRSRAPPR